jgi:ATP adenylyltransferase
MLEPGTLWSKTLAASERALGSGALQPITTESDFLRDAGIEFLVRSVSSLTRKAEDIGRSSNPFLPYDPEMFVADISDTHLCLLNKFNVIHHHLLIITRRFEDQEELLTLRDMEAIQACLGEFGGLAFYNGGEVAGASQRHKHLQMIPLPLAERGPVVPIEPLLARARFRNALGTAPGLPFVHCIARSPGSPAPSPGVEAEQALELYRRMLEAVGLDSGGAERQSGPYNLLLTREWMLLVPRSREHFESISINALGFAGALLVRDEAQMKSLRDHGPMAALRHTGIPG